MFARAGISSRAFRGEHTGGFFGRPKKKKTEKRKFRCYVPFMWPTCVAVCCGLALLGGGTAMCITGYYAKNFTSIEVTNGTDTWYEVDPIPYALMWNMTYVGPVLMGFGCFTIVIACVVVCETRDKMLKIIEEDERQGKKTVTKPDFYDLVIKKLRKEPDAGQPPEGARPGGEQQQQQQQQQQAAPRRKSLFNMLLRRSSLKSIKSTKSEFAHIGSALRQIPMQIFAIEFEQKKKSSLLPFTLTLGVDIGRKRIPLPDHVPDNNNIYLVPKYPSASCIVDLLKLNEEKLNSLFPDMNSWLAEVQPLSRKWKKMTRDKLVPFAAAGADSRTTHSDSRDADESDTDSLCSVTVHVQGTKDKPKCHVTSLASGGEHDSRNLRKMSSDTSRTSSLSSKSFSIEDGHGHLAVPGQDHVRRHPRRPSLLRQQRVAEDSLPPSPEASRLSIVCDTRDGDRDLSPRASGAACWTVVRGSPRRLAELRTKDAVLERCQSGPSPYTAPPAGRLFCSEDADDCASDGACAETRKLLGDQSYNSDTTLSVRRPTRHQTGNSLFVPYVPARSNARINSDMCIPRHKTHRPPSGNDPYGFLRKPKPGQPHLTKCPTRPAMTSHRSYDSERPPADEQRSTKSSSVSGLSKAETQREERIS